MSRRPLIRFGVFELDLEAEQLRKRGVAVSLRGQPLKVLRLLLARPGEVVTRDELRRTLWDASTFVEFDVGVNAAIRRLRRALGDSAEVPRFIETLPGRGYRFVAPVEHMAPSPDPPSSSARLGTDARAGRSAHMADSRGLRWRWWAAVAAALLVGLGAARWVGNRLAMPATSGAPIHSVAVLPFQNLSSDEEFGFFAAGLADALLAKLGQVHELKVISRTSTLRYAGTTLPLPQIAHELGVDALVEGSVLSTPDRVRVTLQLIDGRTDTHLWSNSYERPRNDLIALQHDLVTAIVREMGVAVTREEATRLDDRKPVASEAYVAYLRGRYFWDQRTEEGLRRAIPFFEGAIRLSPDYAAAHAGLADVYGLLPRYSTVDPKPLLAESRRYALKALELDPGVAEAHTALAKALYTLDWNWAESGSHFTRAVALNPSYATAHHWYSLYLMNVGRLEEALVEALRAREVDPVAFAVQANAAWVRYLAGDDETAEREAHVDIEMAPQRTGNYELLGWIRRKQGRFDEAITGFQTAIELAEPDPRLRSALASAYAAAGRRADAEAILRDLEVLRRTSFVPTEAFARIQTALGNLDEAFAWLERCAEDRSISYSSSTCGTRISTLHSEGTRAWRVSSREWVWTWRARPVPRSTLTTP